MADEIVLRVHDCEHSGFNGFYKENGTNNDQPQYINPGGHKICECTCLVFVGLTWQPLDLKNVL
eukprot:m.240162 g.240162  ORF g.240162 m.240162 type:complete len:64 (-) comp33761_c0_seq3:108-299(-)